MILTRRLRTVAMLAIGVLFFFFIYSRRDSLPLSAVEVPKTRHDSAQVPLNVNEEKDDEINKEISKEKAKENADVAEAEDKEDEAEGEAYDPVQDFLEIRSLAPMTVFSKSYCPFSQKLKKLLFENYVITPPLAVVELDKHLNGQKLQEYLRGVTERGTVPNVVIGKSHVSKGGCDDLVKLHEEGKLEELLNIWGEKKMTAKRIEPPLNA